MSHFMCRYPTAAALLLGVFLLVGFRGSHESQGMAADLANLLKNQPITTAPGTIGDLLRQWWKEGTAAGNVGDWYDNRDGAHSDLDTRPYPQLQRVKYSDEDVKLRKHWAAQRVFLPFVVFGNSSTSAPPTAGGSNPRMYYTGGPGLQFLHEQYRTGNLYIYPEHRDHDPGHNGRGDGYGDLYPTNTPYLIISQGSSGSDQPFMRALPYTLAAFRPEVKTKLKEQRMLMPTIQWILRSTHKSLKDPKEYLTGKAHPTVFEGSGVDELAMVRKAHALTLHALPPLVQLKVLEEDQPRQGIDFFDSATNEKLADTPGALARIWRGKDFTRRLVVSAAESFDIQKQPLTFTWVVLRGDVSRIRITSRNKQGSEAEVVVKYHPRRPIAPGAALESNRVDIGVFAHNGVYYSPPAFLTFYSLDNESRTYDEQGRVLEIGYNRTNYVDPRLAISKEWRDVYRYDAQGRLLGWTRHVGPTTTEFGSEGVIVLEKDKFGRCTKGRVVNYGQESFKGKGFNPNPLQFAAGDSIVTFAYADDQDFRGRALSKEPNPAPK